MEDTGTIPFQSLAIKHEVMTQTLSRIHYIRVFDLEGFIETLSEIHQENVILVLSHLGAMCRDRVYQEAEAKGNSLANEIMLQLRQLSSEIGVTSYVVGVEGLIGYYLDNVWSIS